jgi:hypothetical protein
MKYFHGNILQKRIYEYEYEKVSVWFFLTILIGKQLGFPPKLISPEFPSEFRSKLVSTFDKIIDRNYQKFSEF